MAPGVRTMPTEMELPTATAMPKPTPSTFRSFPFSLRGERRSEEESRASDTEDVDKVGLKLERRGNHTSVAGKSKCGDGMRDPCPRLPRRKESSVVRAWRRSPGEACGSCANSP